MLNDSGYLKDVTRRRVEAATKECDYVPSSLGKSLHFQRTDAIGLLVTPIEAVREPIRSV